MSGSPPPIPDPQPGPYSPVSLSYSHREMKMHFLSESELDTLTSLNGSIDLTFLGISSGALITLIITLLTVQITGAKEFAAFVGATIIAAVLTLMFGARAFTAHRASQKKLDEIKHPPPLPPGPGMGQ
jgi:hypothetical protein